MQESGINKRILTWGEAGVGKTTFCSKLTQDWAEIVKGRENPESTKLTEEQRHLLSNIGLVLYVVFRDTHENQSLDDIVQSQIIKAVGEFSFTLREQKYHKDILLVCDGLDEVSYEKSELLEIIAGRMYPNIKCIVTCRPHASLGMSLTADAEIRLKGFSKEQARHYVDMYFRQKYPSNRNLAEQKSIKLWIDIESSPDLLEMSINPSMLQLLCKMFSATGKIAKDRATVFKDYTYFLLQQKNVKLHKKLVSPSELKIMYKGTILKAGHLALQGLKQSHLQLIFTKESVIELAGKEMFDIGFATEVPGHGSEKPKAQFQHKTHQEYLAAYFIVNSSDDVGIKYLMEFCSTSKGLMGSQMILTFITSMSKKMGKMIQKKIRELVSSWSSEDDISPKDRTSFLLTMLKENKSLSFPLPKVIDINVREYEKRSGWFQKILQKFGRKGALETFFSFDNRGVEKISIVLGKEYRLELLKNFKNSHLQVVSVNFESISFEKDSVHLNSLIQNNEKLKLLSIEKMLTLDCRNSEFMSYLVKCKHLKYVKISKCEIYMDIKLADAFKHFPSHVELDISGNIFTSQSGCKALIQNATHLESLIMQDCGIMIDTEIAEAISQLPEQANLDLSGNKVTKMDSSLLCHVIPVVGNRNLDLSGLGVVIDAEVSKAICSLDEDVNVNISDNVIAQMDYQLLCQLLYRIYRKTKVDVRRNRTVIKTELLKVIHMKAIDSDFDITKNKPVKQDIILSLIITADEWKPFFLQDNNEIIIKEAKTVLSQHLLGNVQLDIRDIHIPQMSEPILPTLTACISDKAKVDLSHIQFAHNEIIDQSLLGLPESAELDMSGHHIASKDTCIKLIKKAGTLSALRMQFCGILIDSEIAEAISQLPEQANLDLSGNTVTKMDSSLLCHVIPVVGNKNIDLSGLDVVIDAEVSKAICSLDEDVNVDISHNIIAKMDYQLLCQLLYRLYIKTIVEIYTNRTTIKHNLLQVISMKSADNYFDISSNDTVKQDIILSMLLTADKWKTNFQQDNKEVMTNEAKTVLSQQLQGHVQLEIHDIYLPQMQYPILPIVTACMTDQEKVDLSQINFQEDENTDNALLNLKKNVQLDLSNHKIANKSTSLRMIKMAGTLSVLILQNCGIEINTDIAESLSQLPEHVQLDLSGNQVTDKSACITLINKATTMKSLNIHNCMSNCGIEIDTEIAEAVSRLPDHTELDLSCNRITDKSACITIIHKSATMKFLSLCNCGIQIDTEIAEAVSRLPDHTQLDLAGNDVTKMEPYLLSRLLTHMKNQENINIRYWQITINVDTVRAMSKLSKLKSFIVNRYKRRNILTAQAAAELPNTISCMHQLQVLHLGNCGIGNDAVVALTDSLSKHCPLLEDLSLSNNSLQSSITKVEKHIQQMKNLRKLRLSSCRISDEVVTLTDRLHKHCHLLHYLDLSNNDLSSVMMEVMKHIEQMKKLTQLYLDGCCKKIDKEIAQAVFRLPDHTELDLSGNRVTDKSACITLINKATTMKSLNIQNCMSNCGIEIDTEIAEAVSRLPDQTVLDLSGNRVTDKSACITLINKAATMKSLNIHNCMSNCGIEIDTEIAEAVSRLPDHTQLDLSGNQVTDKSACITLIHKAATMKSLSICNCGIQIDTEIAEAVSRLPDHIQLDLSGNELSNMKPDSLSRVLTYMTRQQEIDLNKWEITVDVNIVRAMSKLSKLKTINIIVPKGKLTNQAAAEFPNTVSSMPHLLDLQLVGCDISNDVAVALTESLSKHCPQLQVLNLCKNNLSSGMEEAVKHIEQMKNLEQLFLPHCGMNNDVAAALTDCLSKHCPKLKVLSLRNNNLSPGVKKVVEHIEQMKNLKKLFLDNCGISNDEVVALTDILCQYCPLLEELSLDNNILSSGVWDVLEHIKQMTNLRCLRLAGNACVKDDKQKDQIETTLHKSNPDLKVLL